VKLWRQLFGKDQAEKRFTVDDYLGWFTSGALQFPVVGASSSSDVEKIENNFVGYVQSVYKSNGIIAACMLARLMIFSEGRYLWQEILDTGRPGDLFTDGEIDVLDEPWPNGTMGDLLARMIQDVDLAGNAYLVREGRRLRRLRPDWVEIILTAAPSEAVASDIAGYAYTPGGGSGKPVLYLPEQIAHWAPLPDPEAQYRGMSWITPVVREVLGDKYITEHKLNFFINGASLQAVIALKEKVTPTQFAKFVEDLNDSHQGVDNAYAPLVLNGGADVTLLGADLRQLDFKIVQGAGETRIAANSGIHPTILGLSEGLAGSSLNDGNFNAARRLSADKTLKPLWRGAGGALQSVLRRPAVKSRLAVDTRDISFLREDRKDIAEIQGLEARGMRQLVDAGFTAESVKAAYLAQDWSLLEHSGLFSVQLQPPGAGQPTEDAPSDEDDDPENVPDEGDE
jgi:phage portal protein BeeE